jgi:predicted metal-binding membrane protein
MGHGASGCWGLMAALFAVGVMRLGWMALIAAFIAGEKLLPWPVAAKHAAATLLLLLGLAIALVAEDVPGSPSRGTTACMGPGLALRWK